MHIMQLCTIWGGGGEGGRVYLYVHAGLQVHGYGSSRTSQTMALALVVWSKKVYCLYML